MPRTTVPPGSCSKRSCSSASSCRGANFSCCATSEMANPRSSRARASSAPMESVISASLQGLVFRRAREAPPQLVGVALFGRALAELAFDFPRKPQRLGARRSELQMSGDELARVLHVALPVSKLSELQQRAGIVGVELERAREEFFRVLAVFHSQAAHACRRVRAARRSVERVADCLQEEPDRFLLAAGLAKEPAVGVVDLWVV